VTTRLVILGASWDAVEALDVVDAMNLQWPTRSSLRITVEGYRELESHHNEVIARTLLEQGVPYLGRVGDVESAAEVVSGNDWLAAHRAFVAPPQLRWVTLVHPSTAFGTRGRIGNGCVIGPGASIGSNVHLGVRTWVGANSTIGHDTKVSADVRLGAGAIISGGCVIGPRSTIGLGATVLERRNIGEGARVEAGACVTRDVAPYAKVEGVPAVPSQERRFTHDDG
jgi:UDP-3-O-[3-hydroxymyristoyl] glucosamine N-acyltransferase